MGLDLSKWAAAEAKAEVKEEKAKKSVPANIVGFLGEVAKENLALAKAGSPELRLTYGAFTALCVKEGALNAKCIKVAQSSIELVNALPVDADIGEGQKANLQALIINAQGKCGKWPVPAKVSLIKDQDAIVGIYTDYVTSKK